MSNVLKRAGAVVAAMSFAGVLRAQSVAEYAGRVDSLARIWRANASQGGVRDSAQRVDLPADTVRVGAIIVYVDTPYVRVARSVAERLWPTATRAYGHFAERLARHPFVLRGRGGASSKEAVVSGVLDSTGVIRLRGADFADADALVNSWKQKIQAVMSEEVGPDVRSWLAASIAIDPPNDRTWSDARTALILSESKSVRDCIAGSIRRCSEALGVSPTSDPLFDLYDANERLRLIGRFSDLLRRQTPALFDRCVLVDDMAACDSLARSIPDFVVPMPTAAGVRQSLVRYALAVGGDGAFDRFVAEHSPRAQLEAASREPVDQLLMQWRDTLLSAKHPSTDMDVDTAVASLAWVAICTALSMRSSRWR